MTFRRSGVRIRRLVGAGLLGLALASLELLAQQPADPGALTIQTSSLPMGSPRHPYQVQLQAQNGIPPLRWTLAAGRLPGGLKLAEDGTLSGTPGTTGLFRFTAKVTDNTRTPQTTTREFTLRVALPLVLEWKAYPKVSGNRVDGSVLVSNGTEDDFDLTFIVLAVAEDGRATAIGYQRFPLKEGATEFELKFGDTLPRGNYTVHVDTVGEVEEKDQIYRARLQTKGVLPVTVGP